MLHNSSSASGVFIDSSLGCQVLVATSWSSSGVDSRRLCWRNSGLNMNSFFVFSAWRIYVGYTVLRQIFPFIVAVGGCLLRTGFYLLELTFVQIECFRWVFLCFFLHLTQDSCSLLHLPVRSHHQKAYCLPDRENQNTDDIAR